MLDERNGPEEEPWDGSWSCGVTPTTTERLQDGDRALVVGLSPTNEAAVLGLTGQVVAPLGKGAGVLVVADGDRLQVEALDT